ncbi:MAG: CpsD/CapB family tyrosine-protein kinase [Candidatus Krumholzibacteriia bacterium]
MSKIFDALRKAELDPSPLTTPARPSLARPKVHPRRLELFQSEFGRLCSALQGAFPKAKQGQVVLVVGCVEREGATYVTSNLGRVLAATAGGPILCMDANFHSPDLPDVFDIGQEYGLADVYENGRARDLSSVIRAGDVNRLYVLGSGKRRISPVAFFESREFELLLTSLRRTFRLVLVDGPPLLRHSDAIHLAANVDGIVLVVRSKHLKREVIRKGIEMLESIDAPIVGAVLNRRKFAIPTLIYKILS